MNRTHLGDVLSSIRDISMHWEVPIFTSAAYIVWVYANNKRIREKMRKKEYLTTARIKNALKKSRFGKIKIEPEKKTSLHKSVIFLHNMVMSIFSMVVFQRTFSVIWNAFWSMPFLDFLRDVDKKMEQALSVWIWIFYISKYYEICDTVILFVSGKESSFLQMYHHAGAIIACWLVSLSESYTGWIWVVLNSFIHSLMYLYYSMTVFGIRPPFKRIITFLQIGQFFTGIVFGYFYIAKSELFSADGTLLMYQYAAVAFNTVYVTGLIVLFIRFERETYRKSATSSAAKKIAVDKRRKEPSAISSSLLDSSSARSAVPSPV